MSKLLKFGRVLVLIISLGLNLLLGLLLYRSQLITVTRVPDGDTLYVDKFKDIRLLSLNAPELDHCGGKEAQSAGYTKAQNCY